MPLYWSTDKIIAGKYRLVKPIKLDEYYESCEGYSLDLPHDGPDDSIHGFTPDETDENTIRIIKDNLDFYINNGYLEEIPKSDEICIRIGCKKHGTKYKFCGSKENSDKFPLCDIHYDELTELIMKLILKEDLK